jgi:undecaprenyl diphosphate synthase
VISKRFARLPRHLGVIPDGNRRWADARGLERADGYPAGVEPGLRLYDHCRELGIEELSVYCYTKENLRRPSSQVDAFRRACVEFADIVEQRGAALLAVGDMRSRLFPPELRRFAVRSPGDTRVNLLVNCGWQWDLRQALERKPRNGSPSTRHAASALASSQVSRIDLVVRWGGRRRLSGFLPLQCAYADIHVIDTLWPDMQLDEFNEALHWYERQDVTLGG